MIQRILFPLLLLGLLRGQDVYNEKVTTASNVGMTISNLGICGNSFSGSFSVNGYPSCEYPVSSGIEHLFDGGLWIGARINGTTEAVTSGAVDASSGYSTGRSGFEFTSPNLLTERSSLTDNPYYLPGSVSHQDFVGDFTDKNTTTNGIPIMGHDNPLGVDVHFETYNWNYSFANFFVILNFRITNTGINNLDSLYIGYWADGVIRNVNITPPGGTSFYNKGGNGFLDTLYMGYEFDATGDPGYTDSYIGLKFLGAERGTTFYHPKLNPVFACNYNTWQFNNTIDPLYFYPSTDAAKFGKMTTGLNYRPDWASTVQPNIRTPNNRSNLVSVGSLGTLMPGESVDIAFAFVLAKKYDDGNPNTADNDAQRQNLMRNAFWAQTAYNGEDANFNGILDVGEDRDGNGRITRYILPSPPDLPKVKYLVKDHSVEVYWSDNAERSVDPISKRNDFEGYRVYKSALGFDVVDQTDILSSMNLAGSWDTPGNGIFYDNGFAQIRLNSPMMFEGDTTKYWYKYIFDNLQNGWQHAFAVSAFDSGDETNNLESLESALSPNLKRIFPGLPANEGFKNGKPFVYPNPYYGLADWEGSSRYIEDKKIIFANLPAHCRIRIYTVAGDLVDVIEHTEDYSGEDIKWFDTYSDTNQTQFSGGEHAWDIMSADNQILARGIYLFSVEDFGSGKIEQGKFVIIR